MISTNQTTPRGIYSTNKWTILNVCSYLGQCLSQTLSLTNGEGNEVIVSPDSALAIQEPLRSEGCSVTPVVALQYLGQQRLEQFQSNEHSSIIN